MIIHSDCTYFRGDVPCNPHKLHGVHCDDCEFYHPKTGIILIIKLGAVGDVIRTTPLLYRLKSDYPDSAIWWLTLTPDVVPAVVDKVLRFSPEALITLQATHFDILINLDKDTEACALATVVSADEKKGFVLKHGKPAPANTDTDHKFYTGLFDDLSQANTKSYLQEIFEICGWDFAGEEYILDVPPAGSRLIESEGKQIIGLNTGCGERWVSRLWELSRWEQLIQQLQENGYYPVLLGGKQEYEKNQELAAKTGALCPPPRSLPEFIGLMNECDVIVTGVTMGLHIGIGLSKRIVVMNNIFNAHEFELYGRGEIVEPAKKCECYFRPTCVNPKYNCMEYLSVEQIFEATVRQAALCANS